MVFVVFWKLARKFIKFNSYFTKQFSRRGMLSGFIKKTGKVR